MRPFYDPATLRFLLYDVLNAGKLTESAYYQDHSAETFDMVLDAAEQLAKRHMQPYLEEMDREEPTYQEGRVRVHPQMRELMRLFGEGGWINANFGYEEGGQQLPLLISNAAQFIFGAANYSACVYPFLSTGAANLLRHFASPELLETYTPKLYAGQWQGTMALTEPGAGSSLSDLVTMATPTEDGYYRITGQKIFISCGDHDAVDNVVHLMLARIKGAPAGTKGISLFVVPKLRPEGNELVANDLTTAGVFHKMGYKGSPIVHLIMGEQGDCRGYLVGEPNKGLSYMFRMMNEARIAVGLSAVSIASAAYQASLQYARERAQGRPVSAKDPAQPPVPIIQHADVKRLLLFQKSVVEGAQALLLTCAQWADWQYVGTPEQRERYGVLLDLLTPIAKSWPSEMGCLSTSAAIQVMGGYGYCRDFPVEQFYREARIHPIHEGTTGIHGLDLLGRKVWMKDGKALQWLAEEIMPDIYRAAKAGFAEEAEAFGQALESFQQVTKQAGHLLMTQGADVAMADATLYLEMAGYVVVGWQWLRMANIAQQMQAKEENAGKKTFLEGKIATMRYYMAYELPKIQPLVQQLLSANKPTLNMAGDWF